MKEKKQKQFQYLMEKTYLKMKKKRSYIKKTKIRRSFQLLQRTHHQIKVTKRRSHSLKEKDSIFFFCSSLLLGLAVYFYIASTPKDVAIPDVAGEEYEEAKDTLEELELEVEKDESPSEDIEEDHIINTEPKAGKTIKEGDTITLSVSNGKEKVDFEDYIGKEFDKTKQLLEDDDYKEVISYPKNSEQHESEIIEKNQKIEEEEIVPSETKVIFEISAGPETVSLNRLEGLTLEEAEKYIDDHDLTLSSKEVYSDSVDEGEIVKQEPEA